MCSPYSCLLCSYPNPSHYKLPTPLSLLPKFKKSSLYPPPPPFPHHAFFYSLSCHSLFHSLFLLFLPRPCSRPQTGSPPPATALNSRVPQGFSSQRQYHHQLYLVRPIHILTALSNPRFHSIFNLFSSSPTIRLSLVEDDRELQRRDLQSCSRKTDTSRVLHFGEKSEQPAS